MATQVQNRRGTTAEHSTFTGANGELTVDTTKRTLVVHDGATAGGRPLLREDQSNLPTSAPTTGIYNASGSLAISTGGSGRLFVDASGNVGVATGAPSYRLEVNGTISQSSQGTSSALIQAVNAGGIFYHGLDNSAGTTFGQAYAAALWHSGAYPILFATNGTERLRITSAGLVGVGTSSPASLLSVVKAAEGTSLEALRLVNESPNQRSTSSVYIGMYGSNEAYERARILCGNPTDFDGNNGFLSFWTRGSNTLSERLRITSAGLVGIGTSSPDVLLDAQAISGNAKIQAKETTTSKRIQLEANTAYHALYADGAVPVYHYSNGSIALTIDSSQRVGIGDTAPDSTVTIKAAASTTPLKVSGPSSEFLRCDQQGRLLVGTSSSSAEAKLVVQGGATAAGGSIDIQRNATTASAGSTIGSIGFANSANNVGASVIAEGDGTWSAGTSHPTLLKFSTTADGASSPTERMRIANTGKNSTYSTSDSLDIRTSLAAGLGSYLIYAAHSATGVGTGGTHSLAIYTNGNIQNTNGSYTTLSDAKLKENIVDAGSQWNDLKALQIRNWNFKAETGHETHRQIGPIAQELETVCPGLVFEIPDRDADGNETGEVTKGVNQSVLYMKAVKALQEAMERIEVLEQRLTDAGIA